MRKMTTYMEARVLMVGMLVKEFPTQRLVPLMSHTRPMWEFRGTRDDTRPRPPA